jgi:hypothetical protein
MDLHRPRCAAPKTNGRCVAQTVDFMPTFVALAGGALPADRAFDGASPTPPTISQQS